jgi:cyclophilin family peptidyl-prolyl cis-trans isomerase
VPVEPDPADSPIDPTKLVLLVDLANFRPRGDARKVFLQNGHWWTFDKKEKTNLQYIDRCLSELEDQVPGSIIICFCDQNIQKSVGDEDWIEIERRSQLSIYNPDKVFFTQSKTADDALTRAAEEMGSPIISHDKFRAEGFGGIIFDQSFDVQADAFRFTQMENGRPVGQQLGDWWVDRTIDFTEEWLDSNEREVAEFLIRQRVRDCTFEFLLKEEVTHNPVVPENALEKLESRKSEREAKREQQRIAIQGKVKSHTGFTEPETVIYADEWSRLEEYQGRVVTLVGRLVDAENGQLVEWFKNFRQISIIGNRIPETYGKDRFVVVTGRLEEVDGVQSIHLDPAAHIGYRWFADVVAGRPMYLQDEYQVDDFEPEHWRFPSFVPSLSFVRRLRSNRDQGQGPQNDSTTPANPPTVQPPTAPTPTSSAVASRGPSSAPPTLPTTPTAVPPHTPSSAPPTPPTTPTPVAPRTPSAPPADSSRIPTTPPTPAVEENPERNSLKRGLLLGVGVAVVVALGFGVLNFVLNDSSPDTVPGRQITGPTPCPKTDGTEERATKFQQAPTICIDPAKQYTATFDTSQGVIEVALDTKKAPLTVNNFVTLSRYKYYDSSDFYSVDSILDILRGGASKISDSPGYSIEDEGSQFKYAEGDLVMARIFGKSSGSQFFFVTGPKAASFNTQGNYVTFGKITKGLDVAQAISGLKVGESGLGEAPSRVVRINTVVITES